MARKKIDLEEPRGRGVASRTTSLNFVSVLWYDSEIMVAKFSDRSAAEHGANWTKI